ncbi:hypothetical protein Fmac_017986 [Flemingia macrophylla]|uniref:C2 domain-containing protein n=1 Tax=Flemingia macrophylla TaxID=520843 RepID=A0ABD1M3M4_9FABA
MESRKSATMEITIMSAENLCMNGRRIRKDAYVVAHTQSCTKLFTTRTVTQEQERGSNSNSNNNNPSWNEKFMVSDGAKWVTLEVQCKTWFGVRSVGAARVAVDDFLGGFAAADRVQFLSYRLWDEKGRRNGVINFLVRVVKAPLECDEKRTLVEIKKNLLGCGGGSSGVIVTGIPVFCSCPLDIPG